MRRTQSFYYGMSAMFTVPARAESIKLILLDPGFRRDGNSAPIPPLFTRR